MDPTQKSKNSLEDLTRTFDGLLLVVAGINLNHHGQVQVNVLHQGKAWCIQTCDPQEAHSWLGEDATRLIRWDPFFLEDDGLSGIYSKPSFEVPAWIVHWEEIKDLDGVKDREKLDTILGIEPMPDTPEMEADTESGPTQQVWFCEGCRTVGCVELSSQLDDVFSVIYRIEDDHQQRSPDCQIPVAGTRVINTAIISSKPTLVADISIPRWAIEPLAAALGFQERER